MEQLDGVEIITCADGAAFEEWLAAGHHTRREGVWIQMAKKGSGIPSVTSDELVDIGLCFGWISGQRRALDERYYLQKYVPRRPRSLWSQVNVEKVERLTAAGRMREPGLEEVRKARQDGRWDAAYASQRTATVPADLAEALDNAPGARAVFEALDRTARYQLLLPLLQARTPETRRARLARALHTLTDGLQHDG
ncbi:MULTISPECIES: YdeI/OmpD-associated family protein [unclassified Streptomyces]|uniref:YdeI/OmpD-associated family protein n=1 Tax=unclassified Streptomyces TaxID=2593676 RepID=UPI0022B669A9|nr:MULTISPECIES: YdeI/OmpD-associated family protein [unclassified Streptomyces]MCZ7414740.1 YdeI/OmpD-associated family protein [Streptomyces sp. WMMC897]MCZ7431663.1 YdeI/OmpD-associated family protein [Streptomyces sp. WMMC1477]